MMEDRTVEVHFEYYSKILERKYSDTLTIRMLKIIDYGRIAAIRSRFLEGERVESDNNYAYIAEAIAYVTILLKNPPIWATYENLLECVDVDLLMEMYKEVQKQNMKFRAGHTGEETSNTGRTNKSSSEGDGVLRVEESVPKH